MRTPSTAPRYDAGWMSWRLWVPGLAIAALVALVGLGLARSWSYFGYSLVLGVPVLTGVLLGFTVRFGLAWKIVLTLLLLGCLLMTALTLQWAGLLCAVIMAAIIAVPLLLGALLGHLYRRSIDRFRSSRPGLSVAIVVLINPVTLMTAERQFPILYDEQRVVTERLVAAPPDAVWKALVFYEDVPLEPPLLARIGLPHPVATEGIPQGVGDVTVCRYSTGHLTKRVTRFEPGRLLEFDVIEQQGVEDRSVRLTRGSFRLVGAGGDTRVILTTRYVPLLEARLLWGPFERSLARALHEHVLDGIELNLKWHSQPGVGAE